MILSGVIFMIKKLRKFLDVVQSYFESDENEAIHTSSKTMIELVEEAKKEWLAAKEYFNSVNEPELIDYAVHSIKATEKRYNYLLRELKQMELEEIK